MNFDVFIAIILQVSSLINYIQDILLSLKL